MVPRKLGLQKLKSGQILHCVLSRNSVNENHRLIAASIGLAIPKDRSHYGYISEHHTFGETDEKTGDYSEDLSALMLATIQGVEFGSETNWGPERRDLGTQRQDSKNHTHHPIRHMHRGRLDQRGSRRRFCILKTEARG